MLSGPWLCEAASFCCPACTWQAVWFNPLAWSSCVMAPAAGQAQKPCRGQGLESVVQVHPRGRCTACWPRCC